MLDSASAWRGVGGTDGAEKSFKKSTQMQPSLSLQFTLTNHVPIRVSAYSRYLKPSL